MQIYEEECIKAGLNIKKVKSIARRLSRAAKEAQDLEIQIFGGASGELRFRDSEKKGALKIAKLDGFFEGGDGADCDWGDGFLRGE